MGASSIRTLAREALASLLQGPTFLGSDEGRALVQGLNPEERRSMRGIGKHLCLNLPARVCTRVPCACVRGGEHARNCASEGNGLQLVHAVHGYVPYRVSFTSSHGLLHAEQYLLYATHMLQLKGWHWSTAATTRATQEEAEGSPALNKPTCI